MVSAILRLSVALFSLALFSVGFWLGLMWRAIRQLSAVNGAVPETASGSRYVPRHVREQVWKRDNGRCVQCFAEHGVTNRQDLEIDHRVSVAKGGSNSPRNLEVLCRFHNRSKGAAI